MNKYLIKSVDYGWTVVIATEKTYERGDLCICRGSICAILREVTEK